MQERLCLQYLVPNCFYFKNCSGLWTDLDNFDGVEEREGEGGENDEEGAECEEEGTNTRGLVTLSTKSLSLR